MDVAAKSCSWLSVRLALSFLASGNVAPDIASAIACCWAFDLLGTSAPKQNPVQLNPQRLALAFQGRDALGVGAEVAEGEIGRVVLTLGQVTSLLACRQSTRGTDRRDKTDESSILCRTSRNRNAYGASLATAAEDVPPAD